MTIIEALKYLMKHKNNRAVSSRGYVHKYDGKDFYYDLSEASALISDWIRINSFSPDEILGEWTKPKEAKNEGI